MARNQSMASKVLDELPSQPLTSRPLRWGASMVVVAILGWLFYRGHLAIGVDLFADTFQGEPFTERYLGISSLDQFLDLFVRLFSPVVTAKDLSHQLHGAYFLFGFGAAIFIWTIEANRRGNQEGILNRVLTLPALIITMAQLFGVARVAPLYYLISVFTTRSRLYSGPSGHNVDPAVAKSLVGPLIICYYIPSSLMFTPFRSAALRQTITAAWQFAPILPSPLTTLVAAVRRRSDQPARQAPPPPEDNKISNNSNNNASPEIDSHGSGGGGGAAALRRAYRIIFAVSAAAHFTLLVLGLTMVPGGVLSLCKVFVDLPPPHGIRPGPDADAQSRTLFLWDFAVWAATTTVWCMYSLFDMRCLGYLRSRDAAVAALLVVPMAVVGVGPGAAYVGLWWWRENVLLKYQDKKKRG